MYNVNNQLTSKLSPLKTKSLQQDIPTVKTIFHLLRLIFFLDTRKWVKLFLRINKNSNNSGKMNMMPDI